VAKEVARKVDIKPVLEEVLDKIIDTKDPTPFEPEEVADTVTVTWITISPGMR
jgi:hypothetical protein